MSNLKNTIENILKNYVFEPLNEDTKTNITNDISKLVKEDKQFSSDNLRIEFNSLDQRSLKVKVILDNTILEYEIK